MRSGGFTKSGRVAIVQRIQGEVNLSTRTEYSISCSMRQYE